MRIRQGAGVRRGPVARDWAWLDGFADTLDADFVGAVEERPGEQERAVLDAFEAGLPAPLRDR